MIVRVSGGSGGIGDYLEKGAKNGREQTRNELDERIILHGSIAELESVIDTMGNCKSEKYLHITLSFKEQEISHDLLNQISEEFKSFAFSATEPDEFYYYAEAHIPKIKTIIDKQGEEHKRLPHIHAIIPQYNLTTGKKEDFLGNIAHITKFIDAFQEDVNERYQLESPKGNRRKIVGGKDEIINRHKITPDMTRKQVKERVLNIIDADNGIRSVDDLAQALGDFGEITVRTNEKDGQYINIKFSDDKKAINLKDEQFKNTYLATREGESQQTKQSPKDNIKMLENWQKKSKEVRFIRPLGKKKRADYRNLSDDEKIIFLDGKMAEIKGRLKSQLPSPKTNKAKVNRDGISIQDETPSMDEMRYIDEMPAMSEMRHMDNMPSQQQEITTNEQIRGNNNTSRNSGHGLYDLPRSTNPTNQTKRRGHGGNAILTDKLSINKNLHMGNFKEVKARELQYMATDGAKHRQRTRQLEIDTESKKSQWTEAINYIDMRVAIDYLSYHYGIDANLQITKSKDGYDRIRERQRNYTISDYMAKKINLGWDEIKSSLDAIIKQQKLGGHGKSQVNSIITWKKFQAYENELGGIRVVNAKFKQSHKEIIEKTQFSTDEKMTKPQVFAYRKMLSEQREDELKRLNERTKEERDYFYLKPHERYLKYLHNEAEQGDLLCLKELNRVYPMRDEQVVNLSLIEKEKNHHSRFSPMEIGFKVSVNKRGNVQYKDDIDRVIMEDRGDRINVKIKTTENIEKALELAQKRFGTDNFEIKNATESDLKAINEASQASKTKVTIKETPRMTIGRGDSKPTSKDKREGWER